MKNRDLWFIIFLLSSLITLLSGCYRWFIYEAKEPRDALMLLKEDEIPYFKDDLEPSSLEKAILRSITYLKRLPPEEPFLYGPDRYTAKEVISSLKTFLILLKESRDWNELNSKVRELFKVYRTAGNDGYGSMLYTGYYEPVFQGSLSRHGPFQFPLYRKPTDLIEIDLGLFREKLAGERIVARYQDGQLLPYFERWDIDERGVLKGKGLEIVWLKDPTDLYFLQIQGSGEIILEDGKRLKVCYAASNGQPYRSIGQVLLNKRKILPEPMSMQGIRRYLREHPKEAASILSLNKRYIFFRVVEEGPLGNIGVPLTPMRSIAADWRLFPKAALTFTIAERPLMDSSGHILKWVPFSRYTLNQDTGGAIRGAGRVDLFWGKGFEAEIAAGHMQHPGELYFLIKKQKEI